MSTSPIIMKATDFSRDFEIKENQPRLELLEKAMEFIHEEIKETEDAVKVNDREEIIDGFGDVAFLAINGIYKEFRSSGNDHCTAVQKVEVVLNRICDANLGKKQADGSIKYINGKVQKPQTWSPPQYEDLL
jgi:predicted HAD superfamily Cof-like phosphohydrolase